MGRTSGTVRYWVRHHTDAATCQEVVQHLVPPGAAILYTDEWPGYGPVGAALAIDHATVRHGPDEMGRREWARDDDGDGIREVHCNSCEGATTGLRTYLRGFRGVHKKYLALYVATYETMRDAKSISSAVIQRMCFTLHPTHSDHT